MPPFSREYQKQLAMRKGNTKVDTSGATKTGKKEKAGTKEKGAAKGGGKKKTVQKERTTAKPKEQDTPPSDMLSEEALAAALYTPKKTVNRNDKAQNNKNQKTSKTATSTNKQNVASSEKAVTRKASSSKVKESENQKQTSDFAPVQNPILIAAVRELNARASKDAKRKYIHRQLRPVLLGDLPIPEGTSTDAVVRDTKALIGDFFAKEYGFYFHYFWTAYTDIAQGNLILLLQAKFVPTCPHWAKNGKTVLKLLRTMAEDRRKCFKTMVMRRGLWNVVVEDLMKASKSTITIFKNDVKEGERLEFFIHQTEQVLQRCKRIYEAGGTEWSPDDEETQDAEDSSVLEFDSNGVDIEDAVRTMLADDDEEDTDMEADSEHEEDEEISEDEVETENIGYENDAGTVEQEEDESEDTGSGDDSSDGTDQDTDMEKEISDEVEEISGVFDTEEEDEHDSAEVIEVDSGTEVSDIDTSEVALAERGSQEDTEDENLEDEAGLDEQEEFTGFGDEDPKNAHDQDFSEPARHQSRSGRYPLNTPPPAAHDQMATSVSLPNSTPTRNPERIQTSRSAALPSTALQSLASGPRVAFAPLEQTSKLLSLQTPHIPPRSSSHVGSSGSLSSGLAYLEQMKSEGLQPIVSRISKPTAPAAHMHPEKLKVPPEVRPFSAATPAGTSDSIRSTIVCQPRPTPRGQAANIPGSVGNRTSPNRDPDMSRRPVPSMEGSTTSRPPTKASASTSKPRVSSAKVAAVNPKASVAKNASSAKVSGTKVAAVKPKASSAKVSGTPSRPIRVRPSPKRRRNNQDDDYDQLAQVSSPPIGRSRSGRPLKMSEVSKLNFKKTKLLERQGKSKKDQASKRSQMKAEGSELLGNHSGVMPKAKKRK
ncbi:hypothetical protein BJ508DRAFT_327598 [Ascobolus immersus RN42]|uniref:Uncharacterized protein n=1 Tax=Ascobolus immersus RN42 TaxID=1160509 RepID=A0A3N4I1X1_ASCIM|nr:hypothetical protein BJ508DRAFT_327598 [Ascobolus immersus RN42]